MPATLMKGKPLADRIRAEVAEEVKAVGGVGITTVLVGDDPASQIYINLKDKAATAAGMNAVDLRLAADIQEDELVAKVEALNEDEDVDATLLHLPLPLHIVDARVIRSRDPIKDVDGLHPFNAGL